MKVARAKGMSAELGKSDRNGDRVSREVRITELCLRRITQVVIRTISRQKQLLRFYPCPSSQKEKLWYLFSYKV